MAGNQVRSGAAGEVSSRVKSLREQEESDRGGGQEAGIAGQKGIVERRAIYYWRGAMTIGQFSGLNLSKR